METELVATEQVLGRLGNREMERSENNVSEQRRMGRAVLLRRALKVKAN
jgi:hypothetical protein